MGYVIYIVLYMGKGLGSGAGVGHEVVGLYLTNTFLLHLRKPSTPWLGNRKKNDNLMK
jgi:hypothetical protein